MSIATHAGSGPGRAGIPIPLGAASSFDPEVASDDHRFGARETAAVGIKQIYSPMVDVSHEARSGRIAEAGGEDPYPFGYGLSYTTFAISGLQLNRQPHGRRGGGAGADRRLRRQQLQGGPQAVVHGDRLIQRDRRRSFRRRRSRP